MAKLDHLAIQVSDMDASIAFYTGKLGLKLLSCKVDEAHGETFAFLQMEGANLELLQLHDETGQPARYEPAAIRKPYCPHFAISADDLDVQMAELAENEVPIVGGPFEIPGSVRWLYVGDPDNNVIEYIQWL